MQGEMIEESEKLKSVSESKAADLADRLVPYSLAGTIIAYVLTRNAQIALPKPVADTDESHYQYRYLVAIDGMKCSNCAANVENAINALGDTWAHVNLGRKRAEVLSKAEKTEADFEKALKATNYKVTGFEEKQKTGSE